MNLFERLTFEPEGIELSPILWPAGLDPKPLRIRNAPSEPLPRADIVCITYTVAEAKAMADVLSPGVPHTSWAPYTHRFTEYEPELTFRSPAKIAKHLGSYCLVAIGTKTVCLFKSELHLATDSKALPFRKLLAQIASEAHPRLIIDTGTAGGIGSEVVEGDTVAAKNLIFDCTGMFKAEPFAHESFPCTYDLSQTDFTLAESLMAANAEQLRPEASRNPTVWVGDVATCDRFLFDDAEDSFGLQDYDHGDCKVEEMDCSVLGLAAQDLGSAMPRFCSLRSVSDPQMPKGPSVAAEKSDAAHIYLKYGYAAQAATLCAVWQVITEFK